MKNPFDCVTNAAWRCFIISGAFSFGVNLLMLTVPLYMINVFDRVISSRSTETLVYLTLIACFALVIMGMLDLVRTMVRVRLGLWIDHKLSPTVFGKIIEDSGIDRVTSTRLLGQIQDLRGFMSSGAIVQILDAPWLPVFLLLLWIIHPWIGMIGVAATVILLSAAFCNELWTRKPYTKANELQARAQHEAQANIRNSEVISALGMRHNIVGRWMTGYLEAINAAQEGNRISRTILSSAKCLRLIIQVAVLGVGAYLVLLNEVHRGHDDRRFGSVGPRLGADRECHRHLEDAALGTRRL